MGRQSEGHWVSGSSAETQRWLLESELEPKHLDSLASIVHVQPHGFRLPSKNQPGKGSSQEVWGHGEGQGDFPGDREVPGSPSVYFLGCLHRGQAIMSPKRPWPLSGCWRWELSRTSRPSDLGKSCSLSVAYSAVWVTPVRGCGGAWCQYDPLGLTPSWGGSSGPGQV